MREILHFFFSRCTKRFSIRKSKMIQHLQKNLTDIALIMDSSKIISDSLFEKEKELIKRLAEVVSGNNYNVHIAVIQYSMKFTKQYLPAYTVFNLDRIKDTENFSNLIDNIKQSNWLVNISDALRLCEMNVFNSLNRDRPHVPNFIILFVYGTTFLEDDLPHYWAYRIKNAGHHILVISTRRKTVLKEFCAMLQQVLWITQILKMCLEKIEKHWKLRKIGKKKEIDNDEDVDGDFLDAMHFSIDYRVLSLQGAISDVEESMLAWKEFVECESSNTFTEK
ncbi:Vitrin [Trichinella spiralis]|uniref:Vitrin n=1 Tax=Trichinella spiralis TaxID=6334 RepID=A0ABR3KF54_TRISP